MTMISTLERDIAVLTEHLACKKRDLAELKQNRFGEDGRDGDVIRFVRWCNGRKSYTYAAVRACGTWHITGAQSPQFLRWDRLVETLNSWGVTSVTRLVEEVPF
jgi:hypothetical protein